MGDRYVKSDEQKRYFFDANYLYGYGMSECLLYYEIEMRHGHPDLYMDNLVETLSTEYDSNFGYFIEVDLKNPDDLKQKQGILHLLRQIKLVHKISLLNISTKTKKLYKKQKIILWFGLIKKLPDSLYNVKIIC